MSDGCVKKKLEGYSLEYDRDITGARVDMVAGLLMLDVDTVVLAEVAEHASALILLVRWYWIVGK